MAKGFHFFGRVSYDSQVSREALTHALLETVRLVLEQQDSEDDDKPMSLGNDHFHTSGGTTHSSDQEPSDMQVPTPKKKGPSPKAGVPGGPCAHCGATESPQWRRPLTKKVVLCNACGIYYSRHHSLPKRKKMAATPKPSTPKQQVKAVEQATMQNTEPLNSLEHSAQPVSQAMPFQSMHSGHAHGNKSFKSAGSMSVEQTDSSEMAVDELPDHKKRRRHDHSQPEDSLTHRASAVMFPPPLSSSAMDVDPLHDGHATSHVAVKDMTGKLPADLLPPTPDGHLAIPSLRTVTSITEQSGDTDSLQGLILIPVFACRGPLSKAKSQPPTAPSSPRPCASNC